MFTGIIEELGVIQDITNSKIKIKAKTVLGDTNIGDSIAVNGVCLTVTELSILNSFFVADISPETMNITTLKKLKPSSLVNLERALGTNGRFGGHIVSGHIDGIGKLVNIKKENNFHFLDFEIPAELSKYVVNKGSIAINGISLTIANIKNNIISVAIIPHTFENTNFKSLKISDNVNIETDILAKYVEKFLSTSDNKSGINMEFLAEHGF